MLERQRVLQRDIFHIRAAGFDYPQAFQDREV